MTPAARIVFFVVSVGLTVSGLAWLYFRTRACAAYYDDHPREQANLPKAPRFFAWGHAFGKWARAVGELPIDPRMLGGAAVDPAKKSNKAAAAGCVLFAIGVMYGAVADASAAALVFAAVATACAGPLAIHLWQISR